MININKFFSINSIHKIINSNISTIFLKSFKSSSANKPKDDEKIIYNEDLFKKPPEDEKKFDFKFHPDDKDLNEINDNTVRAAVINVRSFIRDEKASEECGYTDEFKEYVLSGKTPLFWDAAYADAYEEFKKELDRNEETIITLDETREQEMIRRYYLEALLNTFNEYREAMINRPEFLKIEDEKAYDDI